MQTSYLSVVTPPTPFVMPADIRGGTSGDTALAGLIAGVTNSITAPMGWLGRSLGEQTLLWQGSYWPDVLPCRPILSIMSVKYLDPAGVEQTLDPAAYRLVGDRLLLSNGRPALANEPDAVRITYKAGGYINVPQEARHAVILAVQHLRDLGATETFLRSETVEGVGVTNYSISPAASETIRKATESLLAGLRLYRS
ncbi:hypothetical protein [Devosia sp. SD17-2]|uniref:hypothetical protein n=1 Tax=Devosia sp. SD17-2 TaxID=2976459 RepID=UPI0023D82242|nr:hypothetical protein [Devosia sp. SD17-2]WEJ32193.1 hypothetical protein NYQ88_14965 [Devosia sp. SD17-2]